MSQLLPGSEKVPVVQCTDVDTAPYAQAIVQAAALAFSGLLFVPITSASLLDTISAAVRRVSIVL